MKRFLILMPAVLALTFMSMPTMRARVETKGDHGLLMQKQKQALEELSSKLTEASLNENSVPSWVSGDLGPADGKPKEAAIEAMRRLAPVFRADAQDEFEPRLEFADELGQTHVRMQQRYRGLLVVGGELIVHMKDKKVISVNGHFIPDINVGTAPSLSADAAVSAAVPTPSFETEKLSSPELLVYAGERNTPRLAWSQVISYIDFNGQSQIDSIYADAMTGELLGSDSLIQTSAVREIYDGHQKCFFVNGYAQPQTLIFQEGDPPPADPFEYAAYKTTGQAYDFYKDKFARDSFDGSGATIKSSVHLTQGLNCDDRNVLAWYNPCVWCAPQIFPNRLLAGDGDGITYENPASSISLVAHEFTHGVINSTAHLNYQKESGALSESFADALGIAAEVYIKGSTNWKMGEDVYTPGATGDAVRYLYDPPADHGQNSQFPNLASANYYPNLVGGQNCSPSPANDECYIHFNSGIGNYAFYLASMGGTHPISGVTVPAIGIDSASQIWYRALKTYLVHFSNYSEARSATLHAAVDLYGGVCSAPAISVQKAWDAVAVPKNYNIISTSGCDVNLLKNPGFESGWYDALSSSWTSHDVRFSQYYANTPAHSGSGMAELGQRDFTGGPDLKDWLYQEVTIPLNTKRTRVSFWLRINTTRTATAQEAKADKLTVQIRNSTDQVLETVTAYYCSNSIANSGSYFLKTYDILKYNGQTIRLYFESFSIDAQFKTQFFIDDVALVVE